MSVLAYGQHRELEVLGHRFVEMHVLVSSSLPLVLDTLGYDSVSFSLWRLRAQEDKLAVVFAGQVCRSPGLPPVLRHWPLDGFSSLSLLGYTGVSHLPGHPCLHADLS